MSGQDAQRGFIYQSIIAMIECMERDDWESIKVEPKTEHDKVDIQLYRKGEILSAIQVKSSKNAFEKPEVERWLNDIMIDAAEAREIKLYLVGDHYTKQCDNYIRMTPQVVKVSLANLKDNCIGKIVNYINKSGISTEVSVADLRLVFNNFFAEIHNNGIADKNLGKYEFEAVFRDVLIPKRKTIINKSSIKLLFGLIDIDRIQIIMMIIITIVLTLLYRDFAGEIMQIIQEVIQGIIP